ncbi:MAG TPA: Hsp20/alpha crystallin family protein [Caulobacteraceae bacterium]|nr:Hsp20/alpha crystallin family protein [Caulobacteraceae bacterium]
MNTPARSQDFLPALSRQASSLFAPLQHQIDRVFDEFTAGFEGMAKFTSPKIDVAETDKAIEVTVELPGLKKSDVKIAFDDGILTVTGEKKFEKEDKARNYRVIERSYGAFSRAVELPKGIKPEDVTAKMADGVLKITAVKPAETAAKSIEITAA